MGNTLPWQDAHQAHEAGRPELKLYGGGDRSPGRPQFTADLTVRGFFEAYVRPVYLAARRAKSRTIEAYLDALGHWDRTTGGPPLVEVDEWTCAAFVAGLAERPGRAGPISNNTIRKHAHAIQAILDLAGPASREHRQAQGLLDVVPFIERPPKVHKPAEDSFTVEEVALLLGHVEAANLPLIEGVTAAVYFASLYQVLYNAGQRIGTWMRVGPQHDEGGRLVLPADVVGKGTRGQIVELNQWARAALDRLRPLGERTGRYFPWPWKWPESRQQLYRQHRLIARCLPVGRRFGFHGFRKLHNNELVRINPIAAQKAGGWTNTRTMVNHYTSQAHVAEAVARLPQPRVRDARQLELFDK